TAQGSSLENCRPKGLGGSNPSPSAIRKRVREAYCAWLLILQRNEFLTAIFVLSLPCFLVCLLSNLVATNMIVHQPDRLLLVQLRQRQSAAQQPHDPVQRQLRHFFF